MSAIDTIIWGLIVIVWVGLDSFAGVLALVIHSIVASGQLFSDFGSLQYHKAGTVVAAIVIVVALMDFASARLRQSFI